MERLTLPHDRARIALVITVFVGAVALGLALLMTMARAF